MADLTVLLLLIGLILVPLSMVFAGVILHLVVRFVIQTLTKLLIALLTSLLTVIILTVVLWIIEQFIAAENKLQKIIVFLSTCTKCFYRTKKNSVFTVDDTGLIILYLLIILLYQKYLQNYQNLCLLPLERPHWLPLTTVNAMREKSQRNLCFRFQGNYFALWVSKVYKTNVIHPVKNTIQHFQKLLARYRTLKRSHSYTV